MLIGRGRDEEALKVLSSLRNLPEDDILLRAEFLEIKAETLFEKRAASQRLPRLYQENSSVWRRELAR